MTHPEAGNLNPPLAADLTRNLPLGDLLALGTQLHADITPAELLREIAEVLHRVVPSPMVYVRLRNADTDALEAVAFVGVADDQQAVLRSTPVTPAFYQLLLQPHFRISESFLLPADQGRCCEPEPVAALLRQATGGQISDVLLMPLRSRSERLMGVIYVVAPETPQAFSLANIQVLEAFVRQAALALENVRLADRSSRLLAKEQLLAELGRDVSATLDLERILARTVARLEVAFQSGAVVLLTGLDALRVAASVGTLDESRRSVRLSLGEGVTGCVSRQGRPYFSNRIATDTSEAIFRLDIDVTLVLCDCPSVVRSYIAVPLLSGGKTIGTINVGSSEPDAFSYEDLDLLEAIAAQISGPIKSALLYEESQRLAEQVQHRADHLMVLNTLARIATATLNIGHVLTEVTEQIQRGFGYAMVELYLVDETTQELIRHAQAGNHSNRIIGYRQHVSLGLLGRTVRTGQTQRIDDVLQDGEYLSMDRPDTRSELCVPIMTGGRVLGILNLESARVAAFTQEDVGVLNTAADILAGAIENDRLHHRAQEAAVLEERNRLARELHDSVTQQLFSMTLTAQAARAHLEKNPQRTATQLERLQETAAAALAEMRALIFQLRPPALSEQGLVSALQQHVAVLSKREGLRIDVQITGDERLARGLEQALYRIVQEALNNVVKHARASRVQVVLLFQEEQVCVQVIDDGQGFDLTMPSRGDGRHLGLSSMRERAAEIGGTLELYSVPDQGTTITVCVPRTREGAEQR